MARAIHPVARSATARWLVIAIALIGLMGQMLVQNQALPGEAPRLTIQRLTGIDIAPGAPVAACDTTRQTMSHTMAHMRHGVHDAGCRATHHHHDGTCPLCPLLHVAAILQAITPFVPIASIRWVQPLRHCVQPRAPPGRACRILPPLRGPPMPA